MVNEREYMDADGNPLQEGFYQQAIKGLTFTQIVRIVHIKRAHSGGFIVNYPDGDLATIPQGVPSSFFRPVDPDKHVSKLEKEIGWVKSRKPITVPASEDIVGL